MKKISMFFAVLVTLMVYTSSAVLALSVTPVYNAATDDLALSGTAQGIVSIRITSDGMSDGSLSKDNLPVVYHQFVADGGYNVTLRMPADSRIGKYSLYITDESGSERKSIICYDKTEADALIDSVSSLSDEEFVEVMTREENIKKLGIDVTDSDYSENTVRIMSKLYNGYTDSNDFTEKYNYCKALNSILGKDRAGVEENLVKYESILGIDYDTAYASDARHTDSVKQSLCSILSTMDYASNISYAQSITGKTGFEAYLMAASALANVKIQENWKGLEKIYTTDYGFLKSEIVDKNSDYSKCEPSKVFGELNKLSFSKLSDLGSNFDLAVTASKPSELPSEKPQKAPGSTTSVTVGGSALGGGSGYETLPQENASQNKLSYSIPQLKEGTAGFSDISDADWFKKPVSALASSGIINGYNDGSFKPFSYITRAEFTKLVASAFSIKSTNSSPFDDVAGDAWYAEAVNNASGAGIITGYEGKFNPENCITRQDAVVIMGRIAKLLDIEYVGYKAFDDMADVSLYAVTTVGSFYSSGILSGNGQGSFNPLDNITRAEASQLIYNLISDMIARS